MVEKALRSQSSQLRKQEVDNRHIQSVAVAAAVVDNLSVEMRIDWREARKGWRLGLAQEAQMSSWLVEEQQELVAGSQQVVRVIELSQLDVLEPV